LKAAKSGLESSKQKNVSSYIDMNIGRLFPYGKYFTTLEVVDEDVDDKRSVQNRVDTYYKDVIPL
jgi:hypothetical protein